MTRVECQLQGQSCRKYARLWSCLLAKDCCEPCYEAHLAEHFGTSTKAPSQTTRYYHAPEVSQ